MSGHFTRLNRQLKHRAGRPAIHLNGASSVHRFELGVRVTGPFCHKKINCRVSREHKGIYDCRLPIADCRFSGAPVSPSGAAVIWRCAGSEAGAFRRRTESPVWPAHGTFQFRVSNRLGNWRLESRQNPQAGMPALRARRWEIMSTTPSPGNF